MLGAWVLPGSLVFVYNFEYCVCNGEFKFRADAKESESIVIHLFHSMSADDFTPSTKINSHSGIEVAK